MGPVLYRRYWTHGAQAPHDTRLLSIALGGYHPSPLLVRYLNKQTKGTANKEQARLQESRGHMLLSITRFARYEDKEDEQHHRFLSFTTLVTALLATRQIVLFYLCKT